MRLTRLRSEIAARARSCRRGRLGCLSCLEGGIGEMSGCSASESGRRQPWLSGRAGCQLNLQDQPPCRLLRAGPTFLRKGVLLAGATLRVYGPYSQIRHPATRLRIYSSSLSAPSTIVLRCSVGGLPDCLGLRDSLTTLSPSRPHRLEPDRLTHLPPPSQIAGLNLP